MGASAGASVGASLGGKLGPFGAGIGGGLGGAAGYIAGSLVPDCGCCSGTKLLPDGGQPVDDDHQQQHDSSEADGREDGVMIPVTEA